MKLLVTGGLGFIGSNFIRYWLDHYPDDSIVNLDKVTYAANPDNVADITTSGHYRFVEGDILNETLVDKLTLGSDVIVHFAAESHVDRSIDDPALFVKTNVLGTYNLLRFALQNKVARFHHISTDEVFGSVKLGSIDQFSEATPYNPSSPYSASKAASDHFVSSFGKTFGLPVTITNCSNNYGPYQNPEKFIPRMITNLLSGQKVPVYGQGLNTRDWLHVEDHCAAIDLVLKKGRLGQTYCVGGLTGGISNIKIVKKVLQILKLDDSHIEFVPDRPAHDNYSVDWSKIKKELGWQPQYTLDTGLKQTVEWYQQHQDWWRQSKAEAERFYLRLATKNHH